MGHWGIEIFEGDTACDMRDEFIQLVDREGKTVEEATRIMLEKHLSYSKTGGASTLRAIFYIGIAAVQLERNCLQEYIKNRTIDMIEQGGDLKDWGVKGGINFEARKYVLEEFRRKLINYK